jgi:hypothetical protein
MWNAWNQKCFWLGIFFRFSNICIYLHNEISWELDPNLNTQCICVSNTPYIHSLKVILCNIFNNFVHETKFHDGDFSTCVSMHKKFQILDFWIRDTHCIAFCLALWTCNHGKWTLWLLMLHLCAFLTLLGISVFGFHGSAEFCCKNMLQLGIHGNCSVSNL